MILVWPSSSISTLGRQIRPLTLTLTSINWPLGAIPSFPPTDGVAHKLHTVLELIDALHFDPPPQPSLTAVPATALRCLFATLLTALNSWILYLHGEDLEMF